MQKKIVITGGIGSGKSSVTKILMQKGYCVWDADMMSREVLFFEEVESAIKAEFGETIFLQKGQLNRDLLREIIFSKPDLKKSLENILHPAIYKLYKLRLSEMEKIAPSAWIFYESSLTLELNRKSEFDVCVVVTSNEENKFERLEQKRNLSKSQIQKIMSTQMSDEEKIAYADYILNNDKALSDLEISVNKLLEHLCKRFSDS